MAPPTFSSENQLFLFRDKEKACIFAPWIKTAIKMEVKKLYRSDMDKKLCGVCGGIGEYFELDSTIIRLLWVIFTFCGGAGLFAYIIAALIMPKRNQLTNP